MQIKYNSAIFPAMPGFAFFKSMIYSIVTTGTGPLARSLLLHFMGPGTGIEAKADVGIRFPCIYHVAYLS